MDIYVGLDGGGSKTEAILFDLATSRVVSVTGGATNPNSVGWEVALPRMIGLIEQGVASLGGTPADIRRVCCAVAGVGHAEYAQRLQTELVVLLGGVRIIVIADALAALSAGTVGREGIVLIGGTGSIAVGERADGHVERAGGYGYLIGDEGSGFDIGRQSVQAAIASVEGRGPDTRLWQVLQVFFHINAPGELTPVIYGSSNPATTVASFAEQAIDICDEDDVASAIVQEAVEHHAKLIDSVWNRLACDVEGKRDGAQSITVVVAGGLYTANDRLFTRLRHARSNYEFHRSAYPPASGAALRAALVDSTSGEQFQDITSRWTAIMETLDSRTNSHCTNV